MKIFQIIKNFFFPRSVPTFVGTVKLTAKSFSLPSGEFNTKNISTRNYCSRIVYGGFVLAKVFEDKKNDRCIVELYDAPPVSEVVGELSLGVRTVRDHSLFISKHPKIIYQSPLDDNFVFYVAVYFEI